MKFNLNHDPNNKTLSIPRAALQLSGLAGVSDLILHTDSGCILLLPGDPTVAELLKTISLISTVAPQLISRLAERSQMAMETGMTETACGTCEHEPHCSGLEIPPCQLAEAGISPTAALESFVEEGRVIVHHAGGFRCADGGRMPPAGKGGNLRMNDTYLYPYSSAEARDRNELSLWRESHKANIACRNAIEDTIRQNFDGMHLDKNCITPVLDEYGYKRTAWVLANTLHELKWDGRFGHANKQWVECACIPKDINHNSDFVVRSHPAVLDGFVTFYRKAVQALDLFGTEHCVGDRAKQDFTGKVLVLSPEALREQYWGQKDQLWYARSGFGCEPHSSGRAVFATCLSDGETARWNREDFTGVLDDKFLPEWAREKLEELMTQEQTDAPTMGGMKMK